MDKNAIKKYAVWARTELIDRVRQRAEKYEITADANPGTDSASGNVLTPVEKTQRQAAIARMCDKGYEYVIEEVAYTWFNRFAAIRYMEVNNYLPTRVRVFTDESGSFKPQILAEAIHLNLDGLDMGKVYALKEQDANDELYKYLLITQCNALSAVLPQMFKPVDEKCKIEKDDYTILLFPDNLLREGSVVERMVSMISEDNWDAHSLDENGEEQGAVQIIGWLYQYYNTEPKAKVFGRKSGTKIKKEEIPAATQLFTPDWIVRYMVENSLGRMWLEGHPNDELKSGWKYYLDEAEQEEDVKAQLAEIQKKYASLKPEKILCIDPCMGSGHIIVYMFDVLMKIYAAYGYSIRESVQSIIENNLYGLDIDDRAAQLASFSIIMKAVQYDSRFLKRDRILQPHIYAIQESNHIQYDKEYGDFLLSESHRETLQYLLEVFQDAKEYGSILNVEEKDYFGFLEAWKSCAEASLANIMMMGWYMASDEKVQALANQAIVLSQKYEIVITNPPYMGSRGGVNDNLYNFINKFYPDSKADLYSVFIEQCEKMTKNKSFYAMITQHGWLFLTSFSKLRQKILQDDIVNMLHLGARAFDEISGEVVQSVSFVERKTNMKAYKATYCRLLSGNSEAEKKRLYISKQNRYIVEKRKYEILDEMAIAYWLSDRMFSAFANKTLGDYAKPRQGMATSDNNRFLRLWFEVDSNRTNTNASDEKDALVSAAKWFPYNKGGGFRKWYGNNDYLINWEENGLEVKALAEKLYKCVTRTIKNIQFYFHEGVTWSTLASGNFNARYCKQGFLFDTKGSTCFFDDESQILYMTAFLNSCVANELLKVLAPTLDYNAGSIAKLPVIFSQSRVIKIEQLAQECIEISKKDWDYFENSWDFRRHPLVESDSFISTIYSAWKKECDDRYDTLKDDEEEINRVFIDIYGLQNELAFEVDEKNITVQKADLQRDVKGLISYAVGCMFGRYSLDCEGIVYTGGEWNESKYYTFPADKDNIIPICDDEYFEDDITGLFVKFIETVYGKDTLDENLQFIANALGGKGTPKDVLRDYFLSEKGFYADHCNTYAVTGSGKRPIYWLFDSGKKNGFKALVYMHRYQPDTIARMRTDYVHEQQSRYRTAIADLENRIARASTSERVHLNKQLSKLKDQSEEIHTYEEKIHHLADRMIAIDLDDGVKKNYEIFKDVLAKIK